MEEEKDKGLSKINILLIGAAIIIIVPIIFTQKSCFITFDDQTGFIGDTIGGITAPFMNLLSAYLVFIAFKEQKKANDTQIKLLKEEREIRINNEIKKEQKDNYELLLNKINNIKKSFENLKVTIFQNSSNVNTNYNRYYYGLEAIEVYKSFINKEQDNELKIDINRYSINEAILIKQIANTLSLCTEYDILMESKYFTLSKFDTIQLNQVFIEIFGMYLLSLQKINFTNSYYYQENYNLNEKIDIIIKNYKNRIDVDIPT